MIGTVIGLGIGGWALHQQPLYSGDRPDPWVLGSAMLITGAGLSQVVHGGMRYDERGVSATHASALLAELPAQKKSAVLFLRDRAGKAKSTRFWGAVMTTAQGLGTATLGGRLWAKGEGGIKTTGIVMTILGTLNVGVGSVHFFGKTRSGRILDRVLTSKSTAAQLQVKPAVFPTDSASGSWASGLSAVGRF